MTAAPIRPVDSPRPPIVVHRETLETGNDESLPIQAFILDNHRGIRVTLFDYGATLASVETPDRSGNTADITLGCDTPNHWRINSAHYGSTIGRFGNRINGAAFNLDGKRVRLTNNHGTSRHPCQIHGGKQGFHLKRWQSRIYQSNTPDCGGVEFTHTSPDGDEGYPGKLCATAKYTLTSNNELFLEYFAATTQPTVVNLINHVYWNLTGDFSKNVLNHYLQLNAAAYLPTDCRQIPTGEYKDVSNTPFDFRNGKKIGADIHSPDTDLQTAGGYDQCFVLSSDPGLRRIARIVEPDSGRVLEILTDQPAAQFYTGNHLQTTDSGKGGIAPSAWTGFCIETGQFPDAPNQPSFPSAKLVPGETYRHRITFRFSTDSSVP
jgi:aldose 1-epimerase